MRGRVGTQVNFLFQTMSFGTPFSWLVFCAPVMSRIPFTGLAGFYRKLTSGLGPSTQPAPSVFGAFSLLAAFPADRRRHTAEKVAWAA